MNRLLTWVVISALSGAACSRSSTPPTEPPAPKALVSGLEMPSFDKDVKPQDDLFHHVNGTWLKKTEIPADKSSYGSFDMLIDKSQEDLKRIVEDAGKAANKAVTAMSPVQRNAILTLEWVNIFIQLLL